MRRKGGFVVCVADSFRAHQSIAVGYANVGIIIARVVRGGCRIWMCEGVHVGMDVGMTAGKTVELGCKFSTSSKIVLWILRWNLSRILYPARRFNFPEYFRTSLSSHTFQSITGTEKCTFSSSLRIISSL